MDVRMNSLYGSGYEDGFQFATYDLFPILPFSIVTVGVFPAKSVPVHPSKTYPSLAGLFNVNVSVVIQ